MSSSTTPTKSSPSSHKNHNNDNQNQPVAAQNPKSEEDEEYQHPPTLSSQPKDSTQSDDDDNDKSKNEKNPKQSQQNEKQPQSQTTTRAATTTTTKNSTNTGSTNNPPSNSRRPSSGGGGSGSSIGDNDDWMAWILQLSHSSSNNPSIPKTHVLVGLSNFIATHKQFRLVFQHKKLPTHGWSDFEIQQFLSTLAMLDTNSKTPIVSSQQSQQSQLRWCGVGEREGRVYSSLVSQRHYGFSHGMGRSGDITEPQPKAVGSSVLVQFTTCLLLDAVRRGSGLNPTTTAAFGVVLPLCTGMTMALILSTLRGKQQQEQEEERRKQEQKPQSATNTPTQPTESSSASSPAALPSVPPQQDIVVWSRIDQKSCFKAIQSAGLTCIVLPTAKLNHHRGQRRRQSKSVNNNATQSSSSSSPRHQQQQQQQQRNRRRRRRRQQQPQPPSPFVACPPVTPPFQSDAVDNDGAGDHHEDDDTDDHFDDSVGTDLDALHQVLTHPAYQGRILAVITTTSCFAPRVPDQVDQVAKYIQQYNNNNTPTSNNSNTTTDSNDDAASQPQPQRRRPYVAHVINHAYGLQCSQTCQLLNRACTIGQVDAIVCSTDKNFLVPVGGAIVLSPYQWMIQQIGQVYAGRASIAPILDLCITLLSMGLQGYQQLLQNRQQVLIPYFVQEFRRVAEKHGERLLSCPTNTISYAMTLDHLLDFPTTPQQEQQQSEEQQEQETETDKQQDKYEQQSEEEEDDDEYDQGELDDDGRDEEREQQRKVTAKELSSLGAMLFSRCVSGTRVIPRHVQKTIPGNIIAAPTTSTTASNENNPTSSSSSSSSSLRLQGFGSSHDDYPHHYLTAACALGVQAAELTEFIQRLDKTLTEFKRKKQRQRQNNNKKDELLNSKNSKAQEQSSTQRKQQQGDDEVAIEQD